MSSTQHQLIKQCATRLRGIVEALDNIHDSTPHRWPTDLDDVHSSAESLLALIKDQAPTQAAQGLAGAALAQPSPAQAEAERPEVVGYRSKESGMVYEQDYGLKNPEALTTVAECERIVGALRADRDSWAEQAEQRLADWDEMRKERDAALARVAELEGKLTDWVHEGFRLNEALAMASDAASKGDAARHAACGMEMEIQELKTKLAEKAGNGEQSAPELLRQALELMPLGTKKRAEWVRRASDLLCTPQAQHSGPEEFSFEYRHPNGESHTVTVSRNQVINEMPDFLFEALCSKFCNCEPVGETNVVECCCDEYAEEFKLLAAAPGNSVPQAWLDVQAERRRQVEAEGWTPEHDDEHSHGQMARAAACYALAGSSAPNDGTAALLVSLAWPWDEQWWKPSTARRDLVKACALALAEIERLDRACISQSPQPGATTASS